MTEQTLILPASLGQAILNYLAGQPYRDVYQLISGLQTLTAASTANSDQGPADHVVGAAA